MVRLRLYADPLGQLPGAESESDFDPADAIAAAYPDTGCDVAPHCLECPLPQCRYENRAWWDRNKHMLDWLAMVRVIQSENLTPDAAAARFGKSRRQIQRIVARCREAVSEGWECR